MTPGRKSAGAPARPAESASATRSRKRILQETPGHDPARAMRENGFDLWLILCQEDNYDPIHDTMTPMKTWRPILQILVLCDRGRIGGVERITSR
jgi:hypothetical protein